MNVELDPVEARLRRAAHGVDDHLGAVGPGDGHAPGEVLEPQRPARLERDRPADTFGFIEDAPGRVSRGGERKDSEGGC